MTFLSTTHCGTRQKQKENDVHSTPQETAMNEKFRELKSVGDFEKTAMEMMSDIARSYFIAEANYPLPSRNNETAFNKFRIRPRVLRDMSDTRLDCRILGVPSKSPIGVSPTGLQALAHEDAEEATAIGCCNADCTFILSCVSKCPVAELPDRVRVRCENPDPTLWMQVYVHRERSETLDLVRKAESSGYSALVVTVDSTNGELWKRNMPDSFFDDVPQWLYNVKLPRDFLDPGVTFEDLKWLIENTRLPVVVKGVLNGEDAQEIAGCGASAIIVSNHGGRLIEKVVSTIDVLEEVVDAVKGSGVDVYLDGGVRSGADIFVALALGAKAVFIGRPAVWGLAVGGEDGVNRVLEILKRETLLTMELAGAARIEDIEKSMVMKMS